MLALSPQRKLLVVTRIPLAISLIILLESNTLLHKKLHYLIDELRADDTKHTCLVFAFRHDIHDVLDREEVHDRWIVFYPQGKSGGLFLCWATWHSVVRVVINQFCIQIQCDWGTSVGRFWLVFVYVSVHNAVRLQQWDYLRSQKPMWGSYLW
ncbi:pepF/M3 family oligoendopeptidase [Striga asiatica]|uniref:PepF/M3 family oligoendopeptidase n=1 Tax=Striga asiatica TaxID=4170 RepID=A0A5A7P1T6_STRAF|nr:pepF/M3 family oligoendopeptidase [Striga asiatica]